MLSELFSGLFGALLASLATVYLAQVTKENYDIERDEKYIDNLKISLVLAFRSEIESLFDLYENLKLKPWVEIKKRPILKMVNIQYDYISIFNSNADKIGLFPHEDAVEFIKFYTFTKAYIDSIRELSRRWLSHMAREEKHILDPKNNELEKVYNISEKDLFELYQYCYEQQEEFYRRRDVVEKTFEKYL